MINYVFKNKLVKNAYVSIFDADDLLSNNCFKFLNKKVVFGFMAIKTNNVFSKIIF